MAQEAEQTLRMSVDTSTPKGIRLKVGRLATLAERECLSQMEQDLMAQAQDVTGTSRPRR